jgi:hypothetical protein
MTPSRSAGERRFLAAALLFIAAVGVAQILYGERISAGRGLGWDGRSYARIAADFPGVVLDEGLDTYRLQRIVPPGVVYVALTALGLTRDDAHIVSAFAVYNLVLLLGSVVLWAAIARAAGLSAEGRWLGFLLLFVNVAHLKMPFYYPVLTDVTAFFLGGCLVYAYLRDNVPGMIAALAVGAFSWPSFLGVGGLLFLFPRAAVEEEPKADPHASLRGWTVALAAAALFLLNVWVHREWFDQRPSAIAAVDRRLLWLSIPLAVAYVVGVCRYAPLDAVRTYLERVRRPRLLVWIGLVVAAAVLVRALATGDTPYGGGFFLRQLAIQPILKPALSLVAHAAYLGLLVWLLLFRWRAAGRAAHRVGAGLSLFVVAVALMGLTSESRQLEHGMFALALAAVLAVEHVRWPAWAPLTFTLVALAGTKIWLSLNRQGFSGKADPFSYPSQYYFMNHGPWMSYEMYALQGALALGAGLLLALALGRSRPVAAAAPARFVPPLLVRCAPYVAGLLVCAAMVELAARVFLERGTPAPAEGDGSRAHPVLGWENVPGASVRLRHPEYDVELRFNSRGRRGREIQYERRPQHRALLLGDTFTEGDGVPEGAMISTVVERTLIARGCGAWEVVNGGVAGYSTDQEYLFYRDEGHRYEPDLVVLLFTADDLAHSAPGRRGKPHLVAEDGRLVVVPPAATRRDRLREAAPFLPVPHGRRHGSAALRALSNRALDGPARLRGIFAAMGLVEIREPPAELWPYGPREENAGMWSRAQAILAALQADVQASGAKFAVFYVPARFEVNAAAWDDLFTRYRMSPRHWKSERVFKALKTRLDAIGVPLIDPREALTRTESAERAYYPWEGLWTAAGHAAAGGALAHYIAGFETCGAALSAAETPARPSGSAR